jgi:hypothetical protein
MTIDRRAMIGATAAALAGGAALNAAVIIAAKADESCAANLSPQGEKSDPIFDLIERHKAQYDAVEANVRNHLVSDEELDAAVDANNIIRDEILAAPFATLAGAAAMIRFLIEHELEPFDYTEHSETFLRRLAEALDQMGAAQS